MHKLSDSILGNYQIEHFYRVNVYVTTFGKDEGKNEPYDYDEDFKDKDLFIAREKAIECYEKTLKGIDREGKYFLPFAPHKEYEEGKHAAMSILLLLISNDPMYGETEHFILGDFAEDLQEAGREYEKTLFPDLDLEY